MGSQGAHGNETSGDRLNYEVVTAVADARDVDPLDLDERLHEVVDPDALWQLFADRPNGVSRDGGEVTFHLAGCEVTVYGESDVEVVGPDSSTAAD